MLNQLPVCPPVNQRKANTFYFHKGFIRYWSGTELFCEHKKRKHRCAICKKKNDYPDYTKIYRQLRRENTPWLPKRVENRTKNTYYKTNVDFKWWDGNNLRCIHKKQLNKCRFCAGSYLKDAHCYELH